MNEQFVHDYNVNIKPKMKDNNNDHPLGYKMDYVKLLEDTYYN